MLPTLLIRGVQECANRELLVIRANTNGDGCERESLALQRDELLDVIACVMGYTVDVDSVR